MSKGLKYFLIRSERIGIFFILTLISNVSKTDGRNKLVLNSQSFFHIYTLLSYNPISSFFGIL